MKNIEIYISEVKIDLFEDTVVSTTYQASDIGSTKDILMTFTKTIEVPFTSINDNVFGFARVLTSNESKVYEKLSARVLRNGVEILTGGYAVVKEVSDRYKINIFGGLSGLFGTVGDNSLQALDLSDLDHDRASSEIEASSFDGNVGDYGYSYPIIQWGSDVTVQEAHYTVNIERMYPCVSISEIIMAILSGAGYTLGTNLADLPDPFGITNIPVLTKKSDSNTDTQYEDCKAAAIAVVAMTLFVEHYNRWITSFPKTLHRAWQIDSVLWNIGEGNFYYDRWNVLSTGTYEIDVKITFAKEDADSYTVRLVTYLNHPWDYDTWDDDWISLDSDTVTTSLTQNTVASFTYLGSLGRGERVSLIINRNSGSTSTPCNLVGIPAGTTVYMNITSVKSETAEYGFNFPIAINLPDVTQADFMKDIAVRFGLIYSVNANTETFYIYKFDDLYYNMLHASLDWSDKLDLSVVPKIKYIDSRYAQSNWYRVLKEDEVSSDDLDWFFNINNTSLPLEKDIYTSIFGGSDSFIIYSGLYVAEILTYNLVEEPVSAEPKPRIIMVVSKVIAASLTLESELESYTHTTVGGSELIAFGAYRNEVYPDEQSLGFKDVLDKFYVGFIASMGEYKHVTANFVLTEVDIAMLQQRYPVYVKHLGAYFYVGKIKNSTGGSDSVELIRL